MSDFGWMAVAIVALVLIVRGADLLEQVYGCGCVDDEENEP